MKNKSWTLTESPKEGTVIFCVEGLKLNPKYDYKLKNKMLTLTSRGLKRTEKYLKNLTILERKI